MIDIDYNSGVGYMIPICYELKLSQNCQIFDDIALLLSCQASNFKGGISGDSCVEMRLV